MLSLNYPGALPWSKNKNGWNMNEWDSIRSEINNIMWFFHFMS